MIVDRRSIGGKRIILWSLAELCAGAQNGKKMEDVGRGNVSYEEEINYIIGVSFALILRLLEFFKLYIVRTYGWKIHNQVVR